ncbi:hypothetical protein GPALN_009802 [Globodera pallida]|nr:hypothetical protein GPALN_009802 [Globodera pallida]
MEQQQQQLHLEFFEVLEDVVGEGEDHCHVAKDCGLGDLGDDDEGVYQAEVVVVVEERMETHEISPFILPTSNATTRKISRIMSQLWHNTGDNPHYVTIVACNKFRAEQITYFNEHLPELNMATNAFLQIVEDDISNFTNDNKGI